MRGSNPIRSPAAGDGSVLDVVRIFPTLQGECLFAGWSAVFVRLGGCNLACAFCDTEFESFAPMTVGEILSAIHACGAAVRRAHAPLVVLTGGEPFRQPIRPLTDALLAEGYAVQIETNGTLCRPLDARVQIVCSPKASGGRYHPLRPDLMKRLSALKFLVSAQQPEYAEIPDLGQKEHGIPVYVQPMDEYDAGLNAANQALALRLAQEKGYRLSLQLHKLLGIE
jgi:organic radical activating enzyme